MALSARLQPLFGRLERHHRAVIPEVHAKPAIKGVPVREHVLKGNAPGGVICGEHGVGDLVSVIREQPDLVIIPVLSKSDYTFRRRASVADNGNSFDMGHGSFLLSVFIPSWRNL